MIGAFKKVFALLSARDRKISVGLFFCTLIMGMIEVIGIALVVPFMMVVAEPDAISHHKKIEWLFNTLEFTSFHWFLFVLGLLVLAVLVFGNIFSAFTTWALTRFAIMQEYKFSVALLKKYLFQPYAFYLTRNTSEMTKNIFLEVSGVTDGILRPGIEALSRMVVVALILGMLLIVDPVLALSMAVVLGGSYVFIFALIRPFLARVGKRQLQMNKLRYQIANESTGGIKDIKLLGAEFSMITSFMPPSLVHARSKALGVATEKMPKYFLESIAFGGIILIVLYLLAFRHDFSKAVPFLALYAFAGYRIMPSLQAIFRGATAVRYNLSKLDLLHDDLTSGVEVPVPDSSFFQQLKPLPYKEQIELRNVEFNYGKEGPRVLNSLNLTIRANTTVGIVGTTGAGKTTLIDIILGLLSPSKGCLLVDGVEITDDNVRAWQKNIGYVPQFIYLADQSITCNIAFGVPKEEVVMDRVIEVARLAQLGEFIDSLPDRYDTLVGERGVRLSGGQRQRIGIARALYRNPTLLILDEATSSLDNVTEQSIIKAVHSLSHKKTIVMIAHRLSTVKMCDCICVLREGMVVSQGRYDELLQLCSTFQRLARSAEGERIQ